MFAEVPVKVGLLPEAPLADGALVRLLLVVDVADVPLEVGRDGEGPLAVLALVGLLAGVRPKVAGQVGRSGKDFAAKLAGVAVLWLAWVNAAVH